MTPNEEELRAKAEKHGQEHIFAFWKELDPAQRVRLLQEVGQVDFELVDRHRELLERN